MAEPLRLEDGKAIAPERPGHGVELDWTRARGAARRLSAQKFSSQGRSSTSQVQALRGCWTTLQ